MKEERQGRIFPSTTMTYAPNCDEGLGNGMPYTLDINSYEEYLKESAYQNSIEKPKILLYLFLIIILRYTYIILKWLNKTSKGS